MNFTEFVEYQNDNKIQEWYGYQWRTSFPVAHTLTSNSNARKYSKNEK